MKLESRKNGVLVIITTVVIAFLTLSMIIMMVQSSTDTEVMAQQPTATARPYVTENEVQEQLDIFDDNYPQFSRVIVDLKPVQSTLIVVDPGGNVGNAYFNVDSSSGSFVVFQLEDEAVEGLLELFVKSFDAALLKKFGQNDIDAAYPNMLWMEIAFHP